MGDGRGFEHRETTGAQNFAVAAGRLTDPRLRENFIECIVVYRDLFRLFSDRWTTGEWFG